MTVGGVVLKIRTNKQRPLYGSLLALSYGNFSVEKSVEWTQDRNEALFKGNLLDNDFAIARLVAASASNATELLGKNLNEQIQIDSQLNLVEDFQNGRLSESDFVALAKNVLEKGGDRLTLVHLLVWAVIDENEKLKSNPVFQKLFDTIKKDIRFAGAHNAVGKYPITVPKEATPPVEKMKQKDEGKFIELPDAEMGNVVVRFPPEASGYLHIGHAKAALLNQHYQQAYKGQLVMRFDDTNPAKENAHFEEVIKEDLKMLGIKPDRWTHTSDLFDMMLDYCEKLLKEGNAYVDDTDTETMRKEREERKDSKNRDNTPEQNLVLWEEMKKGSERGQQCCVRVKMNMKDNNGAMRDPTIYRCKLETHVRTGDKYKVYPTYDFACPIVDSVEGVTHALRTTEYHDRDSQYAKFCELLGIRKPHIWSYSRLNMTHTVMSKRKLTKLVDAGYVDGWDDPRLPTVRGVLRQGLTIEGLKQFILAQGGSRSVVMMEWDKIWAFNKKVLDPIAPRYTALDTSKPLVRVHVEGQAKDEQTQVNLHPKDASIGQKSMWYSPNVLLEQEDAQLIKAGDTVTFVNWGNLKIVDVQKEGDVVTTIKAKLDLDNKDFKKTMKVTWLADVEQDKNIEVKAHYYRHVINKAILEKDDDWMNFIEKDSLKVETFVGEPVLKNLKKSDIVQIQRKTYFICDRPFDGKNIVLIAIPEGAQKDTTNPVPNKKKQQKAESNKKDVKTNGSVGNGGTNLYDQVAAQGNLVRDLKAKDAKSQETKDAIAKLLDLKKQYKESTGADWKPDAQPKAESKPAEAKSGSSSGSLSDQIAAQGNLVRDLKAKDAKSQETKDAIAKLLDLKKQYKESTGNDWKPDAQPKAESKPAEAKSGSPADAISDQIIAQGNLVRELKGKDGKSEETKAAITKLLELKKLYKETAGTDWKPPAQPKVESKPVEAKSGSPADSLSAQIAAQGNEVRNLKAKDPKSQASKDAIAKLLDLKKQYKELTGSDWKPS